MGAGQVLQINAGHKDHFYLQKLVQDIGEWVSSGGF